MKHYCLYLEGNDGKTLHCWQNTKRVSKAECTRCLLAYLVGGAYTSPKPKHAAIRMREPEMPTLGTSHKGSSL